MPRIGQLVFYTRTENDNPFGHGEGLYDFQPMGCITMPDDNVPGACMAPARPDAIPAWVELAVIEALGLPSMSGVIAWGKTMRDFGFLRLDSSAPGTVYAVWRPDAPVAT
jgi:hypothetical protein